MLSKAFEYLCSFTNLKHAAEQAAKGKRSRLSTAQFEYHFADHIVELSQELRSETYRPGSYQQFVIHEPKRRLISAAPFRDRVVHHAYCQVVEPRFERVFIPHSYANRRGKGTHRAITYLQRLAKQYRYVLRLDIRQFFESIDHEILLSALCHHIQEPEIQRLTESILLSGLDCNQHPPQFAFPGDDLLSLCRAKGLPIGNLTSQFWANCYLHGLDLFVKRELGCHGYLRYVDDFALFHQDKAVLLDWKFRIIERLQRLRLRIHETKAHTIPCKAGIPWLGFVVYPDYKRVKARKVVYGRRRIMHRYQQYCQGMISFAEFDASVQGWINHVGFADSWHLREKILEPILLKPGFRKKNF